MKTLEIIGALTLSVITIVILWKVYRYFIPKKYNWNNCPNDHDTMARYGSEKCSKCGSEL